MIRPDTSFITDPTPQAQIASPIEALGKVAQYRNILAQGQLHQSQLRNEEEQIRQHRLANDEAERTQQEHAKFQDLVGQVGFTKAREIAPSQGIRSEYLFKLDDEVNKAAEQIAKTGSEKTKAEEARINLIHDNLAPVLAAEADPVQQKALFEAKQDQLTAAGQLKPEERVQYQGPEQVRQLFAKVTTLKHINAAAEEKRKADEAAAKAKDELRKETDAQVKARQDAAAQLAVATTQQEYDKIMSGLSPAVAQKFPAAFDPKKTPEQVRRMGMTPEQQAQEQNQATTRTETERNHRAMEVIARARVGVESKNVADKNASRKALADVVLANPNLYDELTPTDKGHIAADLAERGFEGFGKKPSEAAVKQITQTRNALDGLRELKDTLKANERLLGPVSGLETILPYATEHKQVQAKIDLVRQRVGKALEGGVLRKEDEEKYKKILATMTDTPDLAISKTESLIADIEREMGNYTDELRRSGRNVKATAGGGSGKKGDPLGIR